MKKLYIYILAILFTITGHSQLIGPIGPGTPTPTPINPIGPIGPIDPIGDGLVTYYKDADGDGWGNPNDKISYMPSIFNPNPPTGYVTRSGDCDDTNNQIYPRDWYLDFDKDGQGSDQELRGLTESDFILGGYPLPSVFSQTPKPLTTTISARVYKGCRPGGPYSYSMTKGDCNDNNSSIKIRTWYRDTDGDNFGTHTDTKQQCDQPEGYISQGFDCDDNDANKVPKYWYRDNDKDGWGKATYVINGQSITSDVKIQCDPPEGYVLKKGDCNDDDPSMIPQIWYLDHDKDGWGKIVDVSILELNNISGFDAKIACTKPIGLYVLKTGDCNDDNDQIHPETVWYQDADGDTWGDPNTTKIQCAQPTGFVSKAGDCEDGMPDIHPGAVWSYDPNTYSPPYISDQNFIYIRTPQKEITNVSEIQKRQDVMEEITYFDGFGRPIQQIGIAQAKDNTQHTFEDVIQHFSYSSIGRQDKDYLPYAEKGEQYNGRYRKGNIEGIVQHYYKNRYEGDFEGVARESVNAYSERQHERSPLARIEKQAAPGKDWAMGNGHEIKFEYATNAINEVRAFTATVTVSGETTLSSPVPYYPVASLTKNITKDENWTSGTDHTTEEFTDKQGRVILKRTYNAAVAHDTYYVYDDFGNLTYVIPPKVDTSDGVSESELAEVCYQYKYDYRNRLIEKKIPGKGWEYIVYNTLDQPIMTQDALLKAESAWLFTKYDIFGRVAYTGKITIPNKIREQLQTEANDFTNTLWVESGNAVMIGGATMYHNNGGYPNAQNAEVLTINYYDDYNFLQTEDAVFTTPNTILEQNIATNTKSLPTGSKVKVLGTNYWITTATWYDKRLRPIYVATANEYLNTTDIIKSKLDFVGKPLKIRSRHQKGTDSEIVTLDTFTYDHIGRMISQNQCIGNDTLADNCRYTNSGTLPLVLNTPITDTNPQVLEASSITLLPGFSFVATTNTTFSAISTGSEITDPNAEQIVFNTYDELGQLTSKKVGNNLQTVEYDYNVRGWLTGINKNKYSFSFQPSGLGSSLQKLFVFNIHYNTPQHGATPLFNGNISETEWKTANDNTQRWYKYSYDALNRITSGISDNTNYNLGLVTYDKNGNITELERNGHRDINVTNFGIMDKLAYSYQGNQLLAVDDASTASAVTGFIDGAETAIEYVYDANGNMISDANKGIIGITYNHLNLPETVTINNAGHTGTISYIYDATGAKQRKIATEGSSLTTDYAGNYVYKNGNLEFFNHPEGIVEHEADGYKYVYQFKDHLGNIRLSYSDKDKDGKIDLEGVGEDLDNDGRVEEYEIIQEKNYYPFGLQHQGNNTTISGRKHNYGFNGKEEQNELDFNTLDFGARFYDPAVGRFFTTDKFTEKFEHMSPYQYAANTPTLFIDKNGEYIYMYVYYKDKKGKTRTREIRYNNEDGKFYYHGGKLKGQEYKGNSSIVASVTKALGDLKSGGDVGESLVSFFANNKTEGLRIAKGNKNFASSDGKTISFAPGLRKGGLDVNGGTDRDSFIGLGHELAHAQDTWQGLKDTSEWFNVTAKEGKKKSVPKAEIYATYIENLIREENNVPLRQYYTTTKYSDAKILQKGVLGDYYNVNSSFLLNRSKQNLKNIFSKVITVMPNKTK